jgi:hypothetical protein
MELLDRYLQAVKKYLPKNRRDDIAAELRSNILEQVEDKEAELGRPLTIEEEEEMLRKHGHPMLVATRYMPQQQLIGSTVFPYYWFTLKAALPMALLAYTVVMSLTFISQPVTLGRVVAMLFNFPQIALYTAFWITIVFIIMDFAQAKYVKDSHTLYAWSPRNLPPVEDKEGVGTKSVFEVIASGLGILWLLAVPSLPFLLLGPADNFLRYMQPAPVWHTFYWAFVAILASQWMIEIVGLFSASWRRVRPLLGVTAQGLVAILFCLLLLRTNEYVILTDAGRELQKYQSVVVQINAGLTAAFKVAAVVLVLGFFVRLSAILWKRMQSNPVMVEKH